MTLTVESEEDDESDSSETEKDDDEGIIFVARATSEILQEGKISGNGVLPVSLPSGQAGAVQLASSLFAHGLHSRQLPFPSHSFTHQLAFTDHLLCITHWTYMI